jgi:hypothetical protein
MFLCVWTAVHLNLPEQKKEWVQKWRRLGWLLSALLPEVAPEVVAWNAWEQCRIVKRMTAAMSRLYLDKHCVKPPARVSLQERFHKAFAWTQPLKHRLLVALMLEPGDLKDNYRTEWGPDSDPQTNAEDFWTICIAGTPSWVALL